MELPQAQQDLIALAESVVNNPLISVYEYQLGRLLKWQDHANGRFFKKKFLKGASKNLEIRREFGFEPVVIIGGSTEYTRQYGGGYGYGITKVETDNWETGVKSVELILSYQETQRSAYPTSDYSAETIVYTFEQDLYKPFQSSDELLRRKREFEEVVARDANNFKQDWKWADVVNRWASSRAKAYL